MIARGLVKITPKPLISVLNSALKNRYTRVYVEISKMFPLTP